MGISLCLVQHTFRTQNLKFRPSIDPEKSCLQNRIINQPRTHLASFNMTEPQLC